MKYHDSSKKTNTIYTILLTPIKISKYIPPFTFYVHAHTRVHKQDHSVTILDHPYTTKRIYLVEGIKMSIIFRMKRKLLTEGKFQ